MNKKFCLLLISLMSFFANAAKETYSVRKEAVDFSASFSWTIADGQFSLLTPSPSPFNGKSQQLILKLGIDEDVNYGYIPAFTYSVDVQIIPYTIANTPEPAITATLEVVYTPAGGFQTKNLNYFKHAGYHKYEITVTPSTSITPINVYIESELTIDRYYEISQTTPMIGCNYVYHDNYTNDEFVVYDLNQTIFPPVMPTVGEVEIWWDYIQGAEEYELEWTWIDNYDQVGTVKFNENDFEHNNTRILTKDQKYRIPIIYAKGYLIYRVRGVGRWVDNNLNDTDIKKYGVWSTTGASIDGPSTTITAWPHYIEIGSVHEALKNWQYQAVYAEDGKKKEIVSYFDGSLRNRQTVTRINSDYQAIVGETIYDNQGRSAIQVLPAPTKNSALKYYPMFNQNNSGDPYSHRDFDWELAGSMDCSVGADLMSNISGASKYYSFNNGYTGSWQDYVPVADQYPFVQVEYTPDNTGRIRTQSGVGDEYLIDGDHATHYFYVQPYQEELNRLFGYEVGYKTRYKKNMVVDANGQVSISYIDPQGRVIATALAGTNTTGSSETKTHLLSLEDENNTTLHHAVNTDLLNKLDPADANTDLDDNQLYASGDQGPLNDVLKLNTQIASTDQGNPHIFSYSVQNFTYNITCTESQFKYPLAYDLTIDLKDDCGNTVFGAGPIMIEVPGLNPGNNYLNSTGDIYTANQTVNLNIGSYSLSKVLKVDAQKLNEYVIHYIQNNQCLYELEDFMVNEDCVQEPLPESESDLQINTCLISEQMMLADLSPLGQYGSTDPTDLTSIFSELTIFSDNSTTPIDLTPDGDENWRHPVTPYLDDNGNPSFIEVNEVSAGVYFPALIPGATVTPGVFPGQYLALPQELASAQFFISEWNTSWAQSLLPYHPEYRYLNYVEDLCMLVPSTGSVIMSSESYNNVLQQINTFSDAQSSLNTIGADLIGDPFTGSSFELFDLDPYFAIDYPNLTPLQNDLKSDFMNVITDNYKNSGLTLWEFCVKAVLCGTDFSGACTIPNSLTSFNSLTSVAQRDQIWNMYKQTYLGEKRKIDQIFMDVYALENGFYNQYIGNENPSIPGLTAYLYYDASPVTGGMMLPVIVNLYVNAITTASINAGTTDYFSWTSNPFSSLFTEKQERFIRIDNLYNATIPESTMINSSSEETNAAIFNQTGRCDLSYDVEYLLNALATGDYLPASVVNADIMPAYTADLNTAMQGITPSAINITSILTGSATNITTNSTGSFIQVNNPTLGSWNDVTELSHLYYIPNSYNSGTGTYNFKVLVKMMVGTDYIEEVLEGTTTVQIGECEYEPVCDREEKFGSNLGAVFTELSEQTLPYTGALTTLVGDWYETSELANQLQDYGFTATIDATSTGFTIESNDRIITVNYLGTFPSTSVITGATCNADGSILTINYIDGSYTNQTLSANVTFEAIVPGPASYPITPDFECGCSSEVTDMETSFTNLFNYVLDGHVGQSIFLPTPELQAVDKYISNNSPLFVSYSFLNGTQLGITFIVSPEVECQIILENPSANLTTIQSILDIDSYQINGLTYFDATAILANGDIVLLSEARIPCLEYTPCEDCDHPSVAVPTSCTQSYTAYMNAITLLNANISTNDEDKFKEYTEEEFCETNLGYVTEAYLNYLNLFGIINTENDYYLSLAQFGNTALNYGFYDPTLDDDLSDVVTAYHTYHVDHPTSQLTWQNYITDIYMVQNSVCPPAVTPTYFTTDLVYPCDPLTQNINTVNAINQYQIYLQNTVATFKQLYLEAAMNSVIENFDMEYNDKEYHYTLYYYDQAGNLIQTVPPQGVDRIESTEVNESIINNARLSNTQPTNTTTAYSDVIPEHSLATNYQYNSLNQLVFQKTPDGGESYFGYDALGRLVVSQNEKQRFELSSPPISSNLEQFSYTKYDGLGRIIEVGEMTLPLDMYDFDENGKFIETGTLNPVDVSDPTFPVNLNATREEITVTVYDELNGILSSEFYDYSTDNTRNRITGVKYYYEDVVYTTDLSTVDFNNATFYDYDVHGNVKEVIQVNKDSELKVFDVAGSGLLSQYTKKKTRYEYDLVSGNVKEVAYQKDEVDQFVHRYHYDADNRITNVETTRDEIIYEQDAKYFYYEHGPLARTETGDMKVAGTDYAYTVQGWIKGVNSENLDRVVDQGQDGVAGGINQMNAEDAFGYSLHYFDGDYEGRFGNDFLAYSSYVAPTPDQDLFNGNIKHMYTANTHLNEEYIGTNHTWYQYDQLNRIKSMNNEILDGSSVIPNQFASTYSYDRNGNLKTLTRFAASKGSSNFDDFIYHYTPGTNQLTHVEDLSSITASDDLANQIPGNYEYNQIGELVSDIGEDIEKIEWTVTGKVDKIFYNAPSDYDYIDFEYDAMGNRIEKKVIYLDPTKNISTFYALDAQGNTMAVYTYRAEDRVLNLDEQHIYGSSRVGLHTSAVEILASLTPSITPYITPNETQIIGDKRYELSNHLGNVLEVISDRKLVFEAAPSGSGIIEKISPDVTSFSDFYPFGSTLPGRSGSDSYGYRYSFNGKENDKEVSGSGNAIDFGARIYDSRVGRWFSRDDLGQYDTPYVLSGNNTTNRKDVDGNWSIGNHYDFTYKTLIKMGYSEEQAEWMAHYASTYADHPTHGVAIACGEPFDDRIDYSKTEDSQNTSLIETSKWHSMAADAEDISDEAAMERGQNFGWSMIIIAGRNGREVGGLQYLEINTLGMEAFGQGIHALQDAVAHKGVHMEADGPGEVDHELMNDVFPSITDQAYVIGVTASAVLVAEVISGNYMHITQDMIINVDGMTYGQFEYVRNQFQIALDALPNVDNVTFVGVPEAPPIDPKPAASDN
jgi:RHS repeat-associated protein